MDKLKLKWKIFAFILNFSILLLIILWLFQTVFLEDFYNSIKTAEVKSNANVISQYVNNEKLLSESIFSISRNADYYIEVFDENGITLKSTGNKKSELPSNIKENIISKLSSGEYTELFSNKPQNQMGHTAGKRVMHSIVFIKQVGRKYILINAYISPVNATVSTLKIQLYFITVIMILLSVILAFIIAKRVSKPIENINQSAKVLSNGSYNTHFDGHGFLEIAELSDTLNKAAAELSKVDNLRRELMANISHDLRTPLSLIYSYAEMMHDFSEEITPEQTQMIMDETTRLSTLVNDVLDVSKLESGNVTLNKKIYNLTESIDATIQRISGLVKKDGYQIIFIHNREVYVNADEVKITQAFYNLLINAITHGGANKLVTVRQSIENGFVKIEVIDNGKGIEPENLLNIWDRYYKVDKTHKRAVTGTGLGLSIVKKIIDLHEGSYGVLSQPEKGSIFWFKLQHD